MGLKPERPDGAVYADASTSSMAADLTVDTEKFRAAPACDFLISAVTDHQWGTPLSGTTYINGEDIGGIFSVTIRT